jgi:signal transduction histidine kinase
VSLRSLRWWSRLSLRLRVTLLATVVLAIGLGLGALVLAQLFVHARLAAVDAGARTEASTVASLAATGDLPSPLPLPAGGTASAQVVDSTGTVLAATASASRVLAIVPVQPERPGLPDRTFTTTTSTLGPTPLRVVVRGVDLRGSRVYVVVAVPISDVTSTLDAMRRVILVVLPIVLLAAAVATWLAIGAALRPVDQLRGEADTLEITSRVDPPQLRIPEGAEELRRLGLTLNRMLGRVHQAGERQRAFIADAAHELRSPIAAVQTQLEVALATAPSAAEWPAIAADVLADVERLSAVATDLLLLARLDAGTADPGRRDDVVDFGKLADAHGASMFVVGDETALRRMLENLTSNATRHARSQIEVAAATAHGDVIVTVDDDGPGIPEQDRERAFGRWVRLDEGRGRGDGGAGLGLPIARAIARSHGGDVELGVSPLGGLRATVRLPAGNPPPFRA